MEKMLIETTPIRVEGMIVTVPREADNGMIVNVTGKVSIYNGDAYLNVNGRGPFCDYSVHLGSQFSRIFVLR